MRLIVVLAYENCQLLDVAGATSVFVEAGEFVSEAPYCVRLVSTRGGPVTADGGVVLGTVGLADLAATDIDTLIVPGGRRQGLRALLHDAFAREWVVAAAGRARRVSSVCTGAFALAAWGLLNERRAATHWEAIDEFGERFPAVLVDPQALFVEDGPLWTAAGVSTGIDMALAMVERDLGRGVALKVARRLVLQMRRPGHQSQFSALLEAQSGSYADLIAWVTDNPAAKHTLATLAARANQSPRTFHRRFSAEIGSTPAVFVERARLDRARTMLEAGHASKRVAVSAGFGSLDRLGRAFRKVHGLSPSEYRSLHGRA